MTWYLSILSYAVACYNHNILPPSWVSSNVCCVACQAILCEGKPSVISTTRPAGFHAFRAPIALFQFRSVAFVVATCMQLCRSVASGRNVV